MNPSLTFVTHYTRLVWLLAHEPGNIDEQKTALRRVVAVPRELPLVLAVRDGRLTVDMEPVPQSVAEARDTVVRLTGHGLREVVVQPEAGAAELLGVARLLAAEPAAEGAGTAARARLEELGVNTVQLTLAQRRAAGRNAESLHAADAPGQRRFGIVTEEDASEMFRHFAAPQAPNGSVEELLTRLASARGANALPILDDLVTVAENAALAGNGEVVADVLFGLVTREAATTDAEDRRAFTLLMRRTLRPALLRVVAALLPERRERTGDYVAVLVRAGEDGADAVIEQLAQATSIGERRVYFDVLRCLQAGVPTLVHMLGDARWFVVRNAADLLGEMQAREAEPPLAELLRHGDDRVRRSAAKALLQLGTRSASRAVHDAMREQSPEVRAQIASAIALRPDARTVVTLTRALDDEEDTEVQVALIDALGRVATPEAVRRLASIAEPDGRLFRRKPSALRVAAVQALGEARTPEARTVLRALAKDRDRAVRDAVARALARATAR